MVSDEQLVDYLDGNLSQSDKDVVMESLKTDSSLQQRYKALLLAKEAVRLYGIKQQVAAIRVSREKEIASPTIPAKIRTISRTVRIAMAVAASLFVLFAGIKGLQVYQLSAGKIYAQTFIDFPVSTTRSATTSIPDIEKAYSNKDYQEVIRLSKAPAISTKDRLIAGIAYLQLQESNSAILVFQQLQKAPDAYQQDIEFYLAMAYVQAKKYKAALPLLRSISQNPQHLYHQQVTTKTVSDVEWLQHKS